MLAELGQKIRCLRSCTITVRYNKNDSMWDYNEGNGRFCTTFGDLKTFSSQKYGAISQRNGSEDFIMQVSTEFSSHTLL